MPKSLVIVESPAKARTISGFLGDDFTVESSYGHIRDLPRKPSEIPSAYKGEPWARIGIDIDNDFKALYVVDSGKHKQISKLRKLASSVDAIYLATDEDREGEAIAWHLLQELSPPTNVEIKRMVFHEITKQAIQNAMEEPRELDIRLVEAQEARRLLDRLYGYELSPVLWKKIAPKLSAGRVQSVAVRAVVEREKERMDFVSAPWWSVKAILGTEPPPAGAQGTTLQKNTVNGTANVIAAKGVAETTATEGTAEGIFEAAVTAVDGVRVASGKDFDATGQLVGAQNNGQTSVIALDEATARQLVAELQAKALQAKVSDVKVKPYTRRPFPPFITSTLQQEASAKLRISPGDTMSVAQSLYEKGLITYMRTDNTSLSQEAVNSAREEIANSFGKNFLPKSPRVWKSKVKNAQEAHEAIRPAGQTFKSPKELAQKLSSREASLYELIYKRTLASQMTDVAGETASITLVVDLSGKTGKHQVTLNATGTVIHHSGFQAAYKFEEAAPSKTAEKPTGNTTEKTASKSAGKSASKSLGDATRQLPKLSVGDQPWIHSAQETGHATKPPARYTEASLIRKLEELGVGRPSTYATIMRTILDRGYVNLRSGQLIPDFTAFSVTKLLTGYFPDLVDYAFTARMEDDLDLIASGEKERIGWLKKFYFGEKDSSPGLKELISKNLDSIDPREINAIPLGEDKDGTPVSVRVGRYGPFVQRGEDTRSLPDDLVPDELSLESALEILATPHELVLGQDPATGQTINLKTGRYGPYVESGEGDEVKRASLFASMNSKTITLQEALKLLELPRVVGVGEAGEEITASNGRYGPYIKMGKETRSLETEEQLFTVTLEECLELLKQPKTRGRATSTVIKEIGQDPASGNPMVLKKGRYGPYVTDGEVNASLLKGDDPESLTAGRAAELLVLRREKIAAGGGKKPANKAARKPANKTARKSASKSTGKSAKNKKPANKTS